LVLREPFEGAGDWRILLGDSDVLYDPEVVFAYWRDLLPGASMRVVPDTGRFLAMTHPELVMAALAKHAD
jgi:pimeloyl-ACP methyl ester carboxylesterase